MNPDATVNVMKGGLLLSVCVSAQTRKQAENARALSSCLRAGLCA